MKKLDPIVIHHAMLASDKKGLFLILSVNNGNAQIEVRFAGENCARALGAECHRYLLHQQIKDAERQQRRALAKQRRQAKAKLRVVG
jgi:hypothetical protein